MATEPRPTDAVIVGVGMTTPVGLTAAETAAAVRAGLALFAQSSLLDHHFEPFVLGEVPDDGMAGLGTVDAGLTAREARLLRLATQPLRECLTVLPAEAPKPGVVVALPAPRLTSGQRPLDPVAFLARLSAQVGGAVELGRSDASPTGRAGGIAAIHMAAAYVSAGHAPFMVAGGVDTFRDAYVLGTLDLEKRVKSATHLDGFIPGEAAAFVLLATRDTARRAGVPALAAVTPGAFGEEPGHLYSEAPYRGDGLAQTVGALVGGGALPLPVREVYSSMNGEQHWAKEWGVSHTRNHTAFDPGHEVHHPADCTGDTGAACGPLMVGLAALGLAGGYRRSPCLVYGSSDDGPRAAVGVLAA
ncbi:Beta-ketoacyl synthase (plasmid) [Gemmatirosa kalamazoonensis]|uniref:Beta-ketoacyl synthase n=1 Tax=Gemmatirosa kalamazoonensis TaxID=861299 RepID=W0RTS1_9BACT|nr:beta-ketoacyl synthase N-terminal-like domain-containing protein [Gemmatirosa kalamazoonensis]AHG92993.1 Beta-ketoacyl synthase [Gemmatirosa kalamazoonensis]